MLSNKLFMADGTEILVNTEDYDNLNIYVWRKLTGRNTTYAQRQDRDGKTVLLHRMVTCAKKGEIVDHINGDGLDNRRENLRICSNKENLWNAVKGKRKDMSSNYKGVFWRKQRNRWVACARQDGKVYHFGSFMSEKDAAESYNQNIVLLRARFSKLNQI